MKEDNKMQYKIGNKMMDISEELYHRKALLCLRCHKIFENGTWEDWKRLCPSCGKGKLTWINK